jgi:1-deoxy-D-xylulose 5-phosphate reductoisomerase
MSHKTVLVVGSTGSIGHLVVEEESGRGTLSALWCERRLKPANFLLK